MRRAIWLVFISLLVVLSLSLSIPALAAPSSPDHVQSSALNISTTVAPVADTYTNANNASTNYGSAAQLRIDDSPMMKGFVKFTVSNVSGTVTKATLRLYATASSSGGYKVFQVTNSWGENTLTAKNAPTFGSVIGPSGAVTSGTWTSVDVSSFVKGNGTFSFGLKNPTSTALAFGSRESANKPQLVIETASTSLPTPTATAPVATLPAPVPTSTPAPSGNEKVLCDGKTFDGASTPFVINDMNGSVRKVIRNCRFINTASKSLGSPEIQILAVDNLLIENSTFDNLRTFQPGNDFVAIKFDNKNGAVAKNVVIRGNKFDRIGSDGVQIGANSYKTSNVTITGNEFIGHDGIGENAIDIKVADGGILISNNSVHGFRPCNSPKRGGNQDCSGSPGEGIVLHTSSAGNPPSALHGVRVTGNQIYNNTYGLVISGAVDITVSGNVFSGNLSKNIVVSNCTNCSIQ